MLAIAEGLLDEVAAQPFTWCDPDDPATTTAINAAACATPEAIGPEPGETRGGAATPFDNVNDYNGLAGITTSITGTAMPPGYSAAITTVQDALGPGAAQVPAAASLRITVTVTHGGETLTVEGYRTRYAPNSPP